MLGVFGLLFHQQFCSASLLTVMLLSPCCDVDFHHGLKQTQRPVSPPLMLPSRSIFLTDVITSKKSPPKLGWCIMHGATVVSQCASSALGWEWWSMQCSELECQVYVLSLVLLWMQFVFFPSFPFQWAMSVDTALKCWWAILLSNVMFSYINGNEWHVPSAGDKDTSECHIILQTVQS